MKHSDEIKEILDMMRQHELVEFELERADFKIRLRKGGVIASSPPPAAAPPPAQPPPAPEVAPRVSSPVSATDAPIDADGIELAVVTSPIVGTFYRSPEPGARNFVEVGDTVRKGQVLCIIEAMKLMNEIECDYDGEVTNVYVENGLPVQYGERLFAIKVK